MSTELDIVEAREASLAPHQDGEGGPLAEAGGEPSIHMILASAVHKGMPPESLEKLFALYEREQDRQAKQAFNEALAAFKKECPKLIKSSSGKIVSSKGTSFEYGYASLSDIEATVGETLTKHGLSYRWGDPVVLSDTRMVQARCIVSHVGGHSESSLGVPVPWESNAGCSAQQKMGVAATYAQRYALIAALGLTSGTPDTDGAAPATHAARMTEDQEANLLALLDEVCSTGAVELSKFCAAYGIERPEDLPRHEWKGAMERLQTRQRGGRR